METWRRLEWEYGRVWVCLSDPSPFPSPFISQLPDRSAVQKRMEEQKKNTLRLNRCPRTLLHSSPPFPPRDLLQGDRPEKWGELVALDHTGLSLQDKRPGAIEPPVQGMKGREIVGDYGRNLLLCTSTGTTPLPGLCG